MHGFASDGGDLSRSTRRAMCDVWRPELVGAVSGREGRNQGQRLASGERGGNKMLHPTASSAALQTCVRALPIVPPPPLPTLPAHRRRTSHSATPSSGLLMPSVLDISNLSHSEHHRSPHCHSKHRGRLRLVPFYAFWQLPRLMHAPMHYSQHDRCVILGETASGCE